MMILVVCWNGVELTSWATFTGGLTVLCENFDLRLINYRKKESEVLKNGC